MRTIAGLALTAAIVLGQAQLLYPCGWWQPGYWQSEVWHQGFYVHRWCPLLPPHG
jgi:hypothetical protein